jgi:hypothetical protein
MVNPGKLDNGMKSSFSEASLLSMERAAFLKPSASSLLRISLKVRLYLESPLSVHLTTLTAPLPSRCSSVPGENAGRP